MDINDQRDYAEEAANARMMREEAEQELAAEQFHPARLATCGTCGRSFPDIYPSGRCPYEYEHEEASDEIEMTGRALLNRAIPMLVRLGDFIGNGPIDEKRAGSMGERCDLLSDIRKYLA